MVYSKIRFNGRRLGMIFIIDYLLHMHFNSKDTPYGLVGNENFLSHTIIWSNFWYIILIIFIQIFIQPSHKSRP